MSDKPASNEIKSTRSIQMGHFRTKDAIAAAVKGEATKLGQIVGVAYGAKEKTTPNPDGTDSVSILITGDFEAVSYATGEAVAAGSIYLPRYYAEEMQAALDKTEGGIAFAVEVSMEPNPKSKDGSGVAYQYAVTNLLPREKNDPVAQLKAKLAGLGKLRLPTTAPALIEAPAVEAAADEAPADDKPAGKGRASK